MKITFILIISLLILSDTFSQSNYKHYFNRNGVKCSESEAFYYKLFKETQSTHIEEEYYIINDQLKQSQELDKDGNSIGYAKEFYPNGKIKSSYKISQWDFLSDYTSKYPNGQKQNEIIFRLKYLDNSSLPDDTVLLRVLNSWDSLGNQLVSNGNGTFQFYYDNFKIRSKGAILNELMHGTWEGYFRNESKKFSEEYNSGYLVKGASYLEGGSVVTYTDLSIQPEPPNGMQNFYKYIGKTMKYPKNARRMGIQGKVFVQFIVAENGRLIEAKVLKGISPECDAEAVKAIKNAAKWKPGLLRGRPVKVRMILPITFALS